jgi:DDE family transposase
MSSQGVSPSVEQISFEFFADLPVIVQRSAGQLSSDAGLLPIRQFDQRWGFTSRMAACLFDPRVDPHHTLPEMLRQRVYGILAGYEDCNDHDTLRDDPVLKLTADRLPDEESLASQPTLSRFENLATPAVLQKLIDFTIATGIERLKQKHGGQLPASITLDLDATDDPTHGNQQLTLFHGYFGQYQYFPLIISEPTTKHIFLAWLRPGTVHASLGADDDLMRIVNALRKERPDIAIHVRADAGFGLPRMYEVCEENDLTYTFGFATNQRLKKLTVGLMDRAVALHEKTQAKARLFECFQYQCDSWPHPRTVVAKAECHAGGTNLRFVTTNLPATPSPADWPSDPVAREVYDDYTLRGESEQRMDELKNGLSMDRLSCHRFMANFFRLLLHTAAFNLLNAMRDDPELPEVLRAGQPCTWRTHVIKVAALVIQSARRVWVQLAANWPWWRLYRDASARALAYPSTA